MGYDPKLVEAMLSKKRAPLKSKYRNVKVTIDGDVFDSKREAQRWHELKLLEHAGRISELRHHPEPFGLHCPTTPTAGDAFAMAAVCTYEPDFSYVEDGQLIVEDAKGVKTALYRLKKKWLKREYGIDIRET